MWTGLRAWHIAWQEKDRHQCCVFSRLWLFVPSLLSCRSAIPKPLASRVTGRFKGDGASMELAWVIELKAGAGSLLAVGARFAILRAAMTLLSLPSACGETG